MQSAINNVNNPIGSTFVCSVNNPLWNSSVNTGTRRPIIIFPGAPGQVVIDSNGLAASAIVTGDGAVIKGGTFQDVGSGAALGGTGDDVVIEDVRATANFDQGISFAGLNSRMSYCELDNNGIKGGGTGNTGNFQTDGMIVEFCNMHHNNTRNQNGGGSASGMKVLFTGNGTYRNNWVHDNHGFGLWLDTRDYDCLIEENVCENNGLSGLMWEANYGAVIRHNYVANNGRNVNVGNEVPWLGNTVNVLLSDNPADLPAPNGLIHPVDFHHNLIDHTGSFGGPTGALIFLVDFTDTTARHAGNHNIHDNEFWLRFTVAGAIAARDQDVVGTPATTNHQIWNLSNVYSGNHYRVASLSTNYWQWGTGTEIGSNKTWAQWQAFHPGDVDRTLI